MIWKHEVGAGFSVPMIADGRLFVHAPVKGENAEEVIALDLKTGEVIWSNKSPREPFNGDLGNGTRATPTVVNGRLYTMGITGVLSCFDTATGKKHRQS